MVKAHEEERNCLRCGRKLTDNVSIERNYGPVCYEKYLKEKELSEQMEMEGVEKMVRRCTGCRSEINTEHDVFINGGNDKLFCYECSHTGSDER